jgi:hypothetical protein
MIMAPCLVFEPAVQSEVIPVVGGWPLDTGERLFQLQEIVDQDDVGARVQSAHAG